MKTLQKKFKITLLSTAMAIALGSASMQMVQANSPDSVMLDASSMSYASDISGNIVLSVAGPEMNVVSTSSTLGSINWNLPADAKDGLYRYEISITALNQNEEEDVQSTSAQRINGSFVVVNGQITTVESENDAPDVPYSDEHTSLNAPSFLKQAAISALDFLMPAAHAAFITTSPDGDIVLEDDSPGLHFRRDPDTANSSSLTQWVVKVDETPGFAIDDFIIYDDTMNRNVLILRDGTPFRQYFGTNVYEVQNMDAGNASVIKIDKTNSVNALIVGTGGNMRLLNDTVFIEKATARLGIGTTTPAESLDVSGKLRLSSPDGGFWNFGGSDDFAFNFKDNTAGSTYRVMTVENSDTVCDNGNPAAIAPCIGFFNADNPKASVHIQKNDGTTQLLVKEGSGTAAIRRLIALENNGGVGFELTDDSISNTWEFRSGGGGTFTVANTGVSGGNMLLTTAGGVLMGLDVASGSSASNFYLKPNGNLDLTKGDLNVPNGNIFVSGIQLNVPDYVFEKDYKLMPLDQLQSYVNKEKHLPNVLSESDIKKAKVVNIGESQMTHLEKIEELTLYTLQQHDQIKALQDKYEGVTMALELQNDTLKERLASLEKLVTNLASGKSVLPEAGEKVALTKIK